MAKWFAAHKYQAVTTDTFQKELEASFGRSVAPLFDTAVYGVGLPE